VAPFAASGLAGPAAASAAMLGAMAETPSSKQLANTTFDNKYFIEDLDAEWGTKTPNPQKTTVLDARLYNSV
jgi:hypothetical protein